MSSQITDAQRTTYMRLRRMGYSKSEAARQSRFSRAQAYRIEARLPPDWLDTAASPTNPDQPRRTIQETDVPPPVPHHGLVLPAHQALEDFSLFRRRYLGRTTSPWQEDAARRMVQYLTSPVREYVVVNAPPGPGKSTLFTHDLPCWLIVRNRRIRIMVGSANFRMAAKYTTRIRRTLSRRSLPTPADADLSRALATHAQAILCEDYGRFHPASRFEEQWSRGSFTVVTPEGEDASEKESTVDAFGFDTEFLGGRYDLVVWDDLVTRRTARTQQTRARLAEDYEAEAEPRLEPGGLLILQGQRIGTHDLYRHCLDQRIPVWWDDPEAPHLLERQVDRPPTPTPSPEEKAPAPRNPWETDDLVDVDREALVELVGGRKAGALRAATGDEDIAAYVPRYHHVVYPAHYEDRCQGRHRISDPPAIPQAPTDPAGGCLLDPRRLPWAELLGHAAQNPFKYRVLYQQEDVDEANALVRRIWVTGGQDPDTGEHFPGCIDPARRSAPTLAHLADVDRSLWWPDAAPASARSLVSIDPSPSRYWAIQWWLWDPTSQDHWLLDALRTPLAAPELLDWNATSASFTGLLEEWHQRAQAAGAPFRQVIVEVNVAQKWLLQYEAARRWAAQRSVTFVAHTTGLNKTDTDKGVEMTRPHWIYGRVHLPYHPIHGKPVSDLLINEATYYPEGTTDDQVMAYWFLCLRAPLLFPQRHGKTPTLLRRPSWLRRPEHQPNESSVPAVLRR